MRIIPVMPRMVITANIIILLIKILLLYFYSIQEKYEKVNTN